MLSRRAKYTIRALQELAGLAPGDTLQAGELAARIKAPVHFLEVILIDMRREGLLFSRRGRHGGYCLAKPAELISIADVIRLVDGPLGLASCASRTAYARCEDCPTPDDCGLRAILLEARDAVARVLEHYTLAHPLTGLNLALTTAHPPAPDARADGTEASIGVPFPPATNCWDPHADRPSRPVHVAHPDGPTVHRTSV